MKKRCLKRDVEKERVWREVLRQQSDSGQSVRAFCRERQLTESAFYFWRRELKQREVSEQVLRADRSASDVEKKVDAKGGDLFVPVVAEPVCKTTAASVEMILPSGAVLRWPGGDVNALAEAIAALEDRLC